MTAPRIDTTRKITNQLIHRLAEALELIEDLHTLGWYRHADYRAKQRVTGGDPTAVGIDLDNHGDPRYRTAYDELAHTLISAHDIVTTAVGTANELFAEGRISTRRDTTADATTPEVIAALADQAERRGRDDHGSTAIIAQPMPTHHRQALDATRLQSELADLRNVIRKTGTRPDRSRLTPTELTAWQNAMGNSPSRRRKARKRP